MKFSTFNIKALTVLAFSFYSLESQSQNTWDGSSINTYTTTGNVGIGINAPLSPLQFSNVDRNKTTVLWEDNAANTHSYYGFGTNANLLRYQVGHANASHVFYAGTNTTVGASLSSREIMRIMGNGAVGIGTSNPSAVLHVNHADGGSIMISNPSGHQGVLAVAGGAGWHSLAATTGDVVVRAINSTNDLILTVNGGDGNTTGSGKMLFATGSAYGNKEKVRMSIDNAGKVSIGDPTLFTMGTPGTYKLYVADGILAEKVRVAIKTTTDWADYVFKPTYKLRSLYEVESFIKTNGHLPEVPSAEEVVSKGIDMAQMDAKLLQKVEELTLYMIELKKENDALKLKVDNLSKQVTK
jgi:trimeric autotransporter adhesin